MAASERLAGEPKLSNDLYKIVVIGSYGAGKSSLISRFCDNFFREIHSTTIGIDYKIRTVTLPDKTRVKLEIFDTAGLEKFRPVASSYYQNASGVVVVYDITNIQSFENVERYIREVKYYIPPDAEIMVIGNKSDLNESRQVSFNVADVLFSHMSISVIETSCRTGENVEAAFFELAQRIHEKITVGTYDPPSQNYKVVIDSTEQTSSNWCNTICW